jgi:hypothetical protein
VSSRQAGADAVGENVGENVGETMNEKRSNVIQMPQFTSDAKIRWQQIPVVGQEELMDNVWCGQCRAVTTIRLHDGKMCGSSLVLSGSCKKCGSAVARVIEPGGDV